MLPVAAGFFCAGIALAPALGRWGLLVGVAALAAGMPCLLRPGGRALALCAFALALGLARMQVAGHAIHPALWQAASSDEALLHGIVDGDPDQGERRQSFVLAVREVQDADRLWRPAGGRVYVTLAPAPPRRDGDALELRGRLRLVSTSEGGFGAYLARRGIGAILAYPRAGPWPGHPPERSLLSPLYDVRRAVEQHIVRRLPSPEAELLAGMLLGRRTAIPADLLDTFNRTGTSHVLAISGANVSIVAWTLTALLGRLLGRRAAVPAMAALILHAALVGMSASVVRATVMGALAALAPALGRRTEAYHLLAAAALTMLLIDPLLLWDAGFQLSFACTAGLFLFGPAFAPVARFVPLLGEVAAATLAATLFSAPILAATFGRLSVIALPANLLVAPLLPWIMLAGWAFVLAAPVPPLAAALGWAAWLPLAAMVRAVEALAALPPHLVALDIPPLQEPLAPALGGYALLLAAATLWRDPVAAQTASPFPASRSTWVLAGSLATAALALLAVRAQPAGDLHVIVLGLERGQAVLLRLPEGGAVLAGGGPSGVELERALGRALPFWQRQLDAVVLPAGARDRAGLGEVLARRGAGLLLDPRPGQHRPDAVARATALWPGTRLVLGSHVHLEAAGPDGETASLVVRHGRVRIVIALAQPGEFPPANALIAPATLLTRDQASMPGALFIATGRPPSEQVAPAGALCTCHSGAIELRSDGSVLRVHRPAPPAAR
jgi:competence protein ComEC